MNKSSTVSNLAGRIAAAVVIGTLAIGSAKADVISSFSFSGATATNGSVLSGSLTYSYDANFNVTAVTQASVTATAAGGAPGYTFSYNVPSVANTIKPNPAIVVNNAANQVYAVQLVANDGSTEIAYPEWQGVGSAAHLIISSPLVPGATSYDGFFLQTAGASATLQAVVADVPEPATLSIIGMGLAAAGLVRRRRRG